MNIRQHRKLSAKIDAMQMNLPKAAPQPKTLPVKIKEAENVFIPETFTQIKRGKHSSEPSRIF